MLDRLQHSVSHAKPPPEPPPEQLADAGAPQSSKHLRAVCDVGDWARVRPTAAWRLQAPIPGPDI